MPEPLSPFALALVRLRRAAGLTQRQLAAAAGVSQPNICDYERGRCPPTLRVTVRLADALGCSLDALAGRAS